MTKPVILLLVATAAVPVSAQWLNHPSAGIPRHADGKPNLSAPAPRTPDGKPDLSGIWKLEHPPCRNAAINLNDCDDYPAAPEFRNIGARLAGGLPYQPWAAEAVKKRTADLGKDDPVAWCQPAGALRLFTYPPYRKIIQTPGVTVILSERDVTYRQLFTDGRALPKDPQPSFNGYSSGRWEGDTLVVETNGFKDGIWLDRNGSPMTEAARMTEKFRRLSFGRLDIELTIDDPKAYTKPWTVTLHQLIVPDTELLDYFCQENEKDTVHLVGK